MKFKTSDEINHQRFEQGISEIGGKLK